MAAGDRGTRGLAQDGLEAPQGPTDLREPACGLGREVCADKEGWPVPPPLSPAAVAPDMQAHAGGDAHARAHTQHPLAPIARAAEHR